MATHIARLRTLATIVFGLALVAQTGATAKAPDAAIGRVAVVTVPLPSGIILRSATYTPSGKILVSYAEKASDDESLIRLATIDDNGANFRPFFAHSVPLRPKANGIRFMVFPDDRRIFTGDYVVECKAVLAKCTDAELLPVDFPSEVASGEAVIFRWSEIIVAPDNRHVAWTTLIARTAMAFVGTIRRDGDRYTIVDPRIVSSLDPFRKDPAHPDGVIPEPVRGGEVKQFVRGGTAMSVVGMANSDLAGSILFDLAKGRRDSVTNPPGYTETTIFSPDERLGITMSTRFSPSTNLAVLNLMPRPCPDSLNMGLNMLGYTYSVTGVRGARGGSVGPVLIDLRAARTRPNYLGVDLARDPEWTFFSPMSWHPGGKKAMWIEGKDNAAFRIRIVSLPDYRPAAPVAPQPTPARMPKAVADMSAVGAFVKRGYAVDVTVHGRRSGTITYRRSATGQIEKRYIAFSDDARRTYSGVETLQANPRGTSVYTADVTLSGADKGVMKLTMTFGPLGGALPAGLNFDRDASGASRTTGYAEFNGKRASVDGLEP